MEINKKRHIAKTISYRIVSTAIGFLIVWGFSGSLKVGGAFGMVEMILKPIIYYLHERVYYKYVKFGLNKEK